jgi:hypothetical protein
MPTPEEQARRKSLKNAAREAERDSVRQGLPLSPAQMKELFDFVNERLAESECDHSLRHTMTYLDAHQIVSDPVSAWLRDAGGYFDCEVIMNAEEKFESAFPS